MDNNVHNLSTNILQMLPTTYTCMLLINSYLLFLIPNHEWSFYIFGISKIPLFCYKSIKYRQYLKIL